MNTLTHETLLQMWEEDSQIDRASLDKESLLIPQLHHKYLKLLMEIKSKKVAYNHKIEEVRKEKELYYSGQATSDAYKEKPFDVRLKTKSGVEKHVNTDPEVIRLREKLEYMDILLEGINHILESIKWRNSNIKSAIDWCKFTAGEL